MNDKIIKKAAMFGLDARLALAIYASLSLIIGASMYKIFVKSDAMTLFGDMTEVNKALEQYYIDTRTTPPDSSDGPKVLQAKALVEQPTNLEKWKGPYISYKVSPGNYVLNYPDYQHIHLLNLNNTVWNNSMTWWSSYLCSSSDCSIWIFFNGIDNSDYATHIDRMLDKGDGFLSGDFRMVNLSGGKFGYLLNTHIKKK